MSPSATFTAASAAAAELEILPNVYSGIAPSMVTRHAGPRLGEIEMSVLGEYTAEPLSSGTNATPPLRENCDHGVHFTSSSCACVCARRSFAILICAALASESVMHFASVTTFGAAAAVAATGTPLVVAMAPIVAACGVGVDLTQAAGTPSTFGRDAAVCQCAP